MKVKVKKLLKVTVSEHENANCLRTVYVGASNVGEAAKRAVRVASGDPYYLWRPATERVELIGRVW